MNIKETIARALYRAQGGIWENAKDFTKNLNGDDDDTVAAFYQTDGILSALKEADYVVVKREPTRDMQLAGSVFTVGCNTHDATKVWKTMIAAQEEE